MIEFIAGGRNISVYSGTAPGGPVVYLNTHGDEGSRVWEEVSCPEFTLVAVNGLVWDHDMSPWGIPPISEGDTPCTGGADDYLRLLTEEIIPKAEGELPGAVSWRGIAGYSLAGLFAVYALYQTELFARAATVSGSLWFPEFREYVFSHEMKRVPECVYFSLGDAECRTKNPYLKIVQECTEGIEGFYRSQGINTVFRLNPGGHFQNGVGRTAAGIRWILGL